MSGRGHCAHCGSEQLVRSQRHYALEADEPETAVPWVLCVCCGMNGPQDAWNRRAPVRVSREGVERAVKAAIRDANIGGGYLNADQLDQATAEALRTYRSIASAIIAALGVKVED